MCMCVHMHKCAVFLPLHSGSVAIVKKVKGKQKKPRKRYIYAHIYMEDDGVPKTNQVNIMAITLDHYFSLITK